MQNWRTPPSLSWVPYVVVSSMPSCELALGAHCAGGRAGGGPNAPGWTDAARAKFLADFDPDLIDWYGGLPFNRADFARARGVAASASEEFEYEESLQFASNDTLHGT